MSETTVEDEFVMDLNVMLPSDLETVASLVAIQERASNAPDPNATGKFALALARNRLWGVGRTLRVHFLDAAQYPAGRVEMVMAVANEWTRYANLTFVVSADPASELRVSFNPRGGCWSQIGTNALSILPPAPTINLSVFGAATVRPDYCKYVLHEFGHAIGCIHEHATPIAGIQWNREVVYRDYEQKYGWDKKKVNFNVFAVFEATSSNHTYVRDARPTDTTIVADFSKTFDPNSIMVYPIPKEHTKNGYFVEWRSELSDMDKAFIATIYPKEN